MGKIDKGELRVVGSVLLRCISIEINDDFINQIGLVQVREHSSAHVNPALNFQVGLVSEDVVQSSGRYRTGYGLQYHNGDYFKTKNLNS